MIPKYKIVEVFPDINQIVVRFYSDTVTEEMVGGGTGPNGEFRRAVTDLAITLPYPTPTGNDLDGVIRAYFPQRMELLQHIEDTVINNIVVNPLTNLTLGEEKIIDPSVRIVIQDGKPITVPIATVPIATVPVVPEPEVLPLASVTFT